MSAPPFEGERYRREKIARLERDNRALRDYRGRLERQLAQALRVATAGTRVNPATLAAVLEDLDRRVTEPRIEKLVRVLKETAP